MSRRKREVSLEGMASRLDSPGDSRLYSDGRRGERKIIDDIDPPPIARDTPKWRKYDDARRRVKRNFRADGAKAAISVLNGIIRNGAKRRSTIWQMMPRKTQERLLRDATRKLEGLWRAKSAGRANGRPTPGCTAVTVTGCFS